MERISAGAGAAGVGVVDREALTVNGVGKVDRCTVEVRGRHLVDNSTNAVKVAVEVAMRAHSSEVQLVHEAGTTARLHRHTKAQIIATFLGEKATNLVRGDIGELNTVDCNGELVMSFLLQGLSPGAIPRLR